MCRRLEAGVECIDEPGRETCFCEGNLCNFFLPAPRETQPQIEYWHALILLVPVLLVLLALGATAFWAIRRRRRGSYNPQDWHQEAPLVIQIDRCSVVLS